MFPKLVIACEGPRLSHQYQELTEEYQEYPKPCRPCEGVFIRQTRLPKTVSGPEDGEKKALWIQVNALRTTSGIHPLAEKLDTNFSSYFGWARGCFLSSRKLEKQEKNTNRPVGLRRVKGFQKAQKRS